MSFMLTASEIKEEMAKEIERRRLKETKRLEDLEKSFYKEESIPSLIKHLKNIYPNKEEKYNKMEEILKGYFKGDFFENATYSQVHNSLSIQDEALKVVFHSYEDVNKIVVVNNADYKFDLNLKLDPVEAEKSFIKSLSELNKGVVSKKELAMKYQIYTSENSGLVSLRPKPLAILVSHQDLRKLMAEMRKILEIKENNNKKKIEEWKKDFIVHHERSKRITEEIEKEIISKLKEFEDKGWRIEKLGLYELIEIEKDYSNISLENIKKTL